ncbi:M20/M25/M40 family metallo-hydrolase [Bradyrhizobium zhanjiangense]|uniref:M20/M25/M40 family metallo-hydrolase n=1 Tax=Bradyrhizobium zhanjiangense TaxID=1325107 RepID=UPI001FE1376A|nr:M20/M25/M40 family metallo-hydrolase [Bradyrhizobium zhanjiangense]
MPYRSQVDDIMHACGHDVHASIALGTALAFHRMRDNFGGRVRVFFQPAEEAEPLGGRTVKTALTEQSASTLVPTFPSACSTPARGDNQVRRSIQAHHHRENGAWRIASQWRRRIAIAAARFAQLLTRRKQFPGVGAKPRLLHQPWLDERSKSQYTRSRASKPRVKAAGALRRIRAGG